ncbi:CBS domain-containing protein [Streptomyces sp. NPDC054833]
MLIQHVMNAPPATVLPTESLEDAARRMADAGVGALPVVDGDAVIGIVTDRDLAVRAMARRLPPHTPVEAIMSPAPATVEADTAVAVAVMKMRAAQVRHLPVVAEGRLIGMVSFDDLFWRLTQELADLAAVVDAARKIPETFHRTRKAPLLDG